MPLDSRMSAGHRSRYSGIENLAKSIRANLEFFFSRKTITLNSLIMLIIIFVYILCRQNLLMNNKQNIGNNNSKGLADECCILIYIYYFTCKKRPLKLVFRSIKYLTRYLNKYFLQLTKIISVYTFVFAICIICQCCL